MDSGIDDLRARWKRADEQAHEAENGLLVARLLARDGQPDRTLAVAVLELRARAEHLRLELEAIERGRQ